MGKLSICKACGKTLWLFGVFFLFSNLAFTQDSKKFAVFFSDKQLTPFSIAKPEAFLSQRALVRRMHQRIPIGWNDIPVVQSYVDSIASTGVNIYNRSRWLNFITIDTTGAPNAMKKIGQFPFVKSHKPVGDVLLGPPTMKLPPSGDINYGTSEKQASLIGAECLHKKGYRGAGMVIAVIDDGFYHANSLPLFDSLWYNNQILGTKDFSAPGSNVFEEDTHGMCVLSTMGGNMNGTLVGTAPKASFWLLRSEVAATENMIEEYNWVAAAEFADSVGADIITSSLGYTTFDNPAQNQTYADMNGRTAVCSVAATIAAEKGIVVLVAAGNSGATNWHYIGAPADADSILSVGAVNGSGVKASFSSFGPTVDQRVKPDVMAVGANAIIAKPNGGINPANGTSFATPELAGAVACLWQANPFSKNMDIVRAVQQSASQYTSPDSAMGYGIPNVCKASDLLGNQLLSSEIQHDSLWIYPNPFQDGINVFYYTDTDNYYQVELYDRQGKLLYNGIDQGIGKQYNVVNIGNIAGMPAGLYLLRLSNSTFSYQRKIIKF